MMRYSVFVYMMMYVSYTRCQTIDIDSDKRIPLTLHHIQDNYTISIDTILGVDAGNSTTGQKIEMNVDLTYNDVLVPSKFSNFGFICNGDSSCKVGPLKSFIYQSYKSDNANSANTMMRFAQTDTQGKLLKGLDFTYFTPNQDWIKQVGSSGVLGLGPQSPLWKLLDTSYNKPSVGYYDYSIKYKLNKEEDMYRPSQVEMSSDAQLTINGRTSDNKLIVKDVRDNYTAWVWEGAKISLHPGEDTANINLCIDDSLNTFFIANGSQYDDLKNKILTQLCNTNTSCPRSNSTFTNVDNMEVTLIGNDKKKVTIALGAIDFINYDADDNAQFGILPLNQSTVCSNQNGSVVYGVGRLFLTKAELTIRYLGDNKFQLAASNIPEASNKILAIILVLLGIFIVCVIGTISYFNYPRKEKELLEGGYKAEDN